MVKIAKLALEDGTVIKGEGFGYETTNWENLFFQQVWVVILNL